MVTMVEKTQVFQESFGLFHFGHFKNVHFAKPIHFWKSIFLLLLNIFILIYLIIFFITIIGNNN